MMYRPAHPGEILKYDILAELDPKITVTAAAKKLGVSRPHLSNLLNGKISISPEMAIRLSKATGTQAEFWMNLQIQHDLWIAMQSADQIKVSAFKKAA